MAIVDFGEYNGRASALPASPYEVSSSGEIMATFTGGGAGVKIAAQFGPTPDRESGQVAPLSLAKQQALNNIIHEALEGLRVNLQLILGDAPQGTN
jgi:hypothetical protein